MNKNIEIIKQALNLIKNEQAFLRSTTYLEYSFKELLSPEDSDKLKYKLKALRQDFSKILVIMNFIDTTYSKYQQDKYIPNYYSVISNQATEEIGCLIEYLFVKYRVILEYINKIMDICILYKLDKDKDKNNKQRNKYCKLNQPICKYKFLLNLIKQENKEKERTEDSPLNNHSVFDKKWFNKIRTDRNFIIHEGATCLVFDDKEKLLFQIMTTDALDKEYVKYDEDHIFYLNNKGLIYYERFWGLKISKLIIYIETIINLLIKIGKISKNDKELLDLFFPPEKNIYINSDGTKLPDKQDTLNKMLNKLINS